MRIVYFNGNLEEMEDRSIPKLRDAGHEIIFYDLAKAEVNEKMRWITRHFQMYERVLDVCEKEKADLLYFSCPIGCPEVFIYEMKARPNFKTKITAIFQFREAKRSLTRALVMKDLVDLPQIAKIGFGTMIVDNTTLPENLRKVNINRDKLVFLNEPFNERPEFFEGLSKENCRKDLNLSEKEFVVTLTGSWSYIKGVDIFIEALKNINKNIRIFIHKNREGDPDPSLPTGLVKQALANHPKVTILEKFIDRGKMAPIYIASDIIVCPHRKLYEYSVSGIPGMAAEAKRPIIAPDFYFFNELIRRYKIGLTYEPENPKALASVINYAKENYGQIVFDANFEESIENYIDDADNPFKVLESL